MMAAMTHRAQDRTVARRARALVGFGAVLWAKFGGLVYFDTLAAAFIGCFI